MTPQKTARAAAFGDFQTPPQLALDAVRLLRRLGIRARSILEPTCGRGAFLAAAAAVFPEAESLLGFDIDAAHLRAAAVACPRAALVQGDFFRLEWSGRVAAAAGPWLILGNPPWVTSAGLGAMRSGNLPPKSNFHGRAGIEAITGKSNFDISEWMLLRYLEWLEGGRGAVAVLVKTAVARKVLAEIWRRERYPLGSARIYEIDAPRHFGAAVNACLLVLEIGPGGAARECAVYGSLEADVPSRRLAFLDGHLVSDAAAFRRYRGLLAEEGACMWRSGIKHDCSRVMELAPAAGGYRNGLGETVALEDAYLYPLLKSSDIANGRAEPRAAMLVPQRFPGEDTASIEAEAPQTWDYLRRHAGWLDRRASAVYRNRPPFSVFGVGPYSFAPWKVAISGLYKKLRFGRVGPVNGRPVVFDDTVYFMACRTGEEAGFVESLLRSEPAQAFLGSMIHWDEKRPVTVEVLKRLSMRKVAALLGREASFDTEAWRHGEE